ncbi:hypothetical protein [Nocardia vaccinii]|uniref:hypothetical protein n=1 Tax=Nocardia vaccinii TaxID=1822 RepID=UPI0008363CFA|nr:hypothetical protein [Nocardia vaccinii]
MLDNRSTGNSEPSDPATAAPSPAAEQATATSPSAAEAAIAALADRVATARGKLPLQSDPALFAELSEAEIAAERDLAEWMRKQRRQQRRRAVSAELAAEKRDRRVALSVRRADDADARWHRRALAARRRVSNPDARLAQLYRRAEWSSRALIGVVVLGMLWAGVNVQHNLVPSGDTSDPLYWLSYGFEAMISIPIITIMVVATTAARWGREIARGKVVFLEAALLGVTIALNAGPHLVAGELARSAESAVAPVMVGVVIWLHAWVSARYAQLIDAIPVDDDASPDQPPRRFGHTTVEFGEPRPATFPEFNAEPTDSVALPMGRTARTADGTDTFATRFDPAAGFFGTPAANAEFAAPVAPNDIAAPSATPRQPAGPPNPHGDNRTTAHHPAPQHSAAPPVTEPQQPTPYDKATNPAQPDTADSVPLPENTRTAEAPDVAAPPNNGITTRPTGTEAATRPASIVAGPDSADDTELARNATRQPAPSASAAADASPERTENTRPAHAPAQHPAQRAAAMSESVESPHRAASAQQGTQLALDEQAVAEAAPRRPRPRIVPDPEPETRVQNRDASEAHDAWDDGDEIDPDSDETGVWAVAREISARRLSKLPVEQLAEVLTLADESWTPAAIGASIGLPGSRVLGILEAARRLARPYAVSS